MNAANLDENPAFCPKNTWKLLNNYPKQLWAKAENKFLLRRDGGVILTLFLRVSFLPQVFPAKNISMGARARACVSSGGVSGRSLTVWGFTMLCLQKRAESDGNDVKETGVHWHNTPGSDTCTRWRSNTSSGKDYFMCVYCTFSWAVLRLWVKPNRPVGQLASLS